MTRDTYTNPEGREAPAKSDEAMRQNILAPTSLHPVRAPVRPHRLHPNKVGTTVRVGDNSATSVLATINQVDPIYV